MVEPPDGGAASTLKVRTRSPRSPSPRARSELIESYGSISAGILHSSVVVHGPPGRVVVGLDELAVSAHLMFGGSRPVGS